VIVELAAASSGPDRRTLLQAVAATGVGLVVSRSALAVEAPPKSMRPQPGDRFVFVMGDRAGSPVALADLAQGHAPVLAWPLDPRTSTVRDGSRLNQVLLIRLDQGNLDEVTAPRAADGIVAYSATCTHALCPVTGWNDEKQVFHCQCHQSEFDPLRDGKVVSGPAPRSLPALPVKIEDDALMAAGTFVRKVGLGSS